ncbi:hypothetical protein PMAYCL1PPCAC_30350, partial [Pristionchus mayeri]
DTEGASQNSTQVLDKSLSPEDRAQLVRDELESVTWDKIGVGADLKSAIINAAAKTTTDHLCPKKRARRRLSVLDRTDLMVNKITSTISDLNDLWDKVDMDEDRRLTRVNQAYGHVERLLSEMVSSELAMVTAVHEQISEFTGKVTDMRRELGMKSFNMNAHPAGSIALWKALEADVKILKEQRGTLIEEQKKVIDRFAHLTSRLGSDLSNETAASLPDTSVLAPRAAIDELRERNRRMEKILAERLETIIQGQREMNEWIGRMKCDYDEEVAAVLEVDPRAPESALTADLMEHLEENRLKIGSAYTEWVNYRDSEYKECIVRLHELWEMCCVGEEERRLPAQFDPSLNDSVEEARSEVERLERIYERRRDVYEKIGAWRTHWMEKMQFESSENSMDKYTNRGGSLDQRIKYENRLNKQLLPHAEQAVAEAYSAFLKEHPGERVHIDGMEPLAYISHVVNTHDIEKEMEREQKAQARKAQLLQETKWGTTPNKPNLGRRPLVPTTSSTRLAPLPKIARLTANSGGEEAAAGANFTFDQSAISSISPKKNADRIFPKTSSPKGSRVTVPPGTRFASPARGTPSCISKTPKRPLVPANKK